MGILYPFFCLAFYLICFRVASSVEFGIAWWSSVPFRKKQKKKKNKMNNLKMKLLAAGNQTDLENLELFLPFIIRKSVD